MKILGSDYDGTLNYGGINEDKIAAIQKWREAGNKFGVVSGRRQHFRAFLQQNVPELKVDFLVTCNGGYIMDESGAVIYEARCNDVELSEFVSDLFDFGCKIAHISGEQYTCVVASEEDVPANISADDVYLLKDCPKIDYFNQVTVTLPSADEVPTVVEKIKNKYSKWVTPLQNGRYIDIVPKGVNKAQGLYRVMEKFGCSHEDVITVGNDVNDLDMIREFNSYAMENSVDEVKNTAKGIVSDVAELIAKEL